MSRHPVSDEVAATLGAFVTGGDGPRHSVLTRVFGRTGYASAAPYDSRNTVQQMNKEGSRPERCQRRRQGASASA